MAGKTAVKPKVKKEEPEISMTDIDDLVFRIGKAENDIGDLIETIDGYGLTELTRRVEKVEARLGLG